MRAPKLSYANVVATLALFITLGGVSYAAVKLAPNSVRSGTIVNGQVKSADIGTGQVTSADVRDGSIRAKDIARGAIPGAVTGVGATGGTGTSGAAGGTGTQGPAGPPGPTGPEGRQGPQGLPGGIGATGPGGSAVVASAASGQVTVGPNIGQHGGANQFLTWQQPPNTFDELRGVIRLNYPAGCTDFGEGIDLIITDEAGREISAEVPTNTKPAANSGVTAGDTQKGVKFLIGETIDAPAQDLVGLPIDDPIWRNGGSTTVQRFVRMTAASVGMGCSDDPSVTIVKAFVVRHAP